MVLRVLRTLLAVLFLSAITEGGAWATELKMGFYAFPGKTYLDLLSGSPFNFLLPYGLEGKESAFTDDFLDYASQKGVGIVFPVKDVFKGSKWYPNVSWCPTDTEQAFLECLVGRYGSNPAVVGWYLADEPTDTVGHRRRDLLESNAQAIRGKSRLPIMVEDYPLPRGKMWDDLLRYVDNPVVGPYLVPDKPLSEQYDNVASLTRKTTKDVYALVQVFGKYQYAHYKRDEVTGRPPTMDEVRVLGYLSLIAGARGIIFFSLNDFIKQPDFKTKWPVLVEIGKQLKRDYPLLAEGKPLSGVYNVKGPADCFSTVRRYQGHNVLVAVNAAAEPRQISISRQGSPKGMVTINLRGVEVKTANLDELMRR